MAQEQDDRRFNGAWFEGLNPDQKTDLKEVLSNATFLMGHIKRILSKRLREYERKEVSEELFKEPNWALHQAFINGAIKELLTIADIFTFERTK